MASCTTSCASAGLRASQCARLYAASRYGTTCASKRALRAASVPLGLAFGSVGIRGYTQVAATLFQRECRCVGQGIDGRIGGDCGKGVGDVPAATTGDPTMDDTEELEAGSRRQFLKCMAWAGAGTLWLMDGRVLKAQPLTANGGASAADATFGFVQISDSHIGFHKAPNMDVAGTLQQSLTMINAQRVKPEFVLHTGDLTHLSRPEEFDALSGIMQDA